MAFGVKIGFGQRLAILVGLLLLVGAGLVLATEDSFERSTQLTQATNHTGRLRMLSQNIAYHAYRINGAEPGARGALLSAVEEFSGGMLRAEQELGSAAVAVEAFDRLQQEWQPYRAAAIRAADAPPGSAAMIEAAGYLGNHAEKLLTLADNAVRQVVAQQEQERQRLRLMLAALLGVGITVIAAAYWRINVSVVRPLRWISRLSQSLSSGDIAARDVFQAATEESGELVEALQDSPVPIRNLITNLQVHERSLEDSEVRFRTLWDTSTDAIIVMGVDNIIRYANPAVEAVFGYTPEELVGSDIEILQPVRLRALHRTAFARYCATGSRTIPWQSIEVKALHKSGRELPVEISFSHMQLSSGEMFAAFFRDESSRSAAREALHIRDRAMESTSEGIMITDAVADSHQILYVNPALEHITGYSRDEMIGQNPRLLLGDELDQEGIEGLRHLLRSRRDGTLVLRCRRKDGGGYWNELTVSPVRDGDGKVTHTIGIFKDVTERKRQEEEMIRNAHHDALTGLANRVLLTDRLEQAIANAHRHNRQLGLLFVDLDNFKTINDSLGHDVGDLLLQQMSLRLQECVRDGDTVSRLGGDEFVLLLSEVDNEEQIALVAERVLLATAQPFRRDEDEFFVSASIGAAMFPRDGTDSQTLLKHADIAMYRAKDQGRNNFKTFTEEMQIKISHRMQLETHLRKALERNEFLLHFQPQVSIESGQIVGAEALIRWQHPELGLVSPAQFIPIAEDNGLIVPIGEWVLDEVCRQMAAWRQQGIAEVSIAVNLSARQFRQQNLHLLIESKLRQHNISSLSLELELTESMVMQDPEATLVTLRQMKDVGLRIALDDFGTGYSSLAYLRHFPIDILKIDQSFLTNVINNRHNAAIVASIISLAHNLGLSVIAEGVEAEDQLDFLREENCDMFQGFYFCRPQPAATFAQALARGYSLSGGALAR
ncbi:MAG TPA: EAL domain-containing protein [Rhodocyclaceae bacterium]